VDYIYHTGDIVDHGVWETSVKLVEDSFLKIHEMFVSNFQVPVYSILGNHEAHPVNV
jgi:sphingomyelin phosphodiesterase